MQTSERFPTKPPSLFFIILFFFFFLLKCPVTGAELYSRHKELMFHPCPSLTVSGVSTVTACAALCSQSDAFLCVAGSLHFSQGTCCLSQVSMSQPGVGFDAEDEAVYFQVLQNTVAHTTTVVDSWTLVFRAQAYINSSVYDRWTRTGSHDDVTGYLPAECASAFASGSCTRHVRSKLLDLWEAGALNVGKVKYSFYTAGTEVASVVFNGTGSDRDSWFHPSRVLSSTFTDLTADQTYNFFSIYGLPILARRTFYISHEHNGCPDDKGWMAVVEKAYCTYENLGMMPLFRYSARGEKTIWNQQSTGLADVMMIHVTLG